MRCSGRGAPIDHGNGRKYKRQRAGESYVRWRITEGFGTADLQEAKALLHKLTS
jgi:hypothetical protein